MCGIAAYFGPDAPGRVPALRDRAGRLAHRGPDDRDAWPLGRAALAHERLSIVDVGGGRQPLRSEDGRVALVANGEIYNHAALRASLGGRHAFKTKSDSEVIIHLFEDVGAEAVGRLDGMFAFAVTDGERLLAARDPLGIKPLYYGHDRDGGLWLASEVKALIGVCEAIDAVPPGAAVNEDGAVRTWFRAPWSSKPPASPAPGDPRVIAETLERAVVKRLMADVPVGVFLSGGLDSSLIAALMRRHVDELHSFSVGLEGSSDLDAAREVARSLGTIHHERVYTPADVVAAIDPVIRHLESWDPALIRSAIPCWFVSELAARHVKVVLSGEGSDEAFAGYRYFASYEDPAELHAECARLLGALHNMNLQRVDRMTMAHSLEGRVPFLDVDFLRMAMAIDPREKLHRSGRPEKWLLRRAFEGVLPDRILHRTKLEFAQGCGSEWTVRDHCEASITDAELAEAARVFPEDTPKTKEELHYRRLYERHFPGDPARSTVGRWRGIAA